MRPRAKKSLGQHFLVDENFIGVIDRLAELEPEDVVLEIGPGTGVLTRHLADSVGEVHAVELDKSLDGLLEDALQGTTNVHLVFADAVTFDYGTLEPPPTKLVANLPYNVATPIVVESLERIPSLERWVVMVQREVAERFFASPRTKAYGAVSVLVQLHTRAWLPSRAADRVPSTTARRFRDRRLRALPRPPPRSCSTRCRVRVRAPSQDPRQLAGAHRVRVAGGGRAGSRGHRPRAGRPRRGARA